MLRAHLGPSQLRSGGRGQVDLGFKSSRIQTLTSKVGFLHEIMCVDGVSEIHLFCNKTLFNL